MLYLDNDGTISLTRGDSARIVVDVENSVTKEPYEIQPDDIMTLTVKRKVKDSEIAFQKIAYGTNFIKIEPEDTKHLDWGKYVYDVQITTADDDVYTVIPVSKFVLLEEVTL